MTDAVVFSPASVPLDKPLYGATFGQAVGRLFRKYVTFSGRASRSEFWWSYLFIYGVLLVLLIPTIVVGIQTGHSAISSTTGRPTFVPGAGIIPFLIVGFLFYLAILLPSISVAVRRLHDANFTGALYLLAFLGGIGSLVVLVLCALDSNPRGVQYDAAAPPAPGSALPPPPAPGSALPPPPAPGSALPPPPA